MNEIIFELLAAILTAVASYVGLTLKSLYEKKCNDNTKKQVIKDVVKFVEQVYTDIHGEEKYNKAVESIVEVLNEKNISISEVEIKMLIESTCHEFSEQVKK